MVVGFIGGENWNTQRKPLTCRKLQTDFINVVSNTPHHEWDSNSQL